LVQQEPQEPVINHANFCICIEGTRKKELIFFVTERLSNRVSATLPLLSR
jgi:hypothetical protein